MKPCAIVLLNFNGEAVLPSFLPSVVANSQYDIWLIDNASMDGSLAYVKEKFPSVSLIFLTANYGFTGGYNLGLAQLRDQYAQFILLNTDVEVTPGWDVQLVEFLQRHEAYAAVQPKILSWTDKSRFDYAGAGGGFLDGYGYPYCRGRLWNHVEQDQGQYNDTCDVDWASGACLAMRAADFYGQEGFDGNFFAHMEEIDLCWRLRKSGRKIGYLGAVTVYHLGGATLDRGSSKKLYLNIRNSLSMLYKNVGLPRFVATVVIKGVMEGVAALNYLRQGQAHLAKAILQGYRDFFASQKNKTPTQSAAAEIPSAGPVRFVFGHYLFRGVRKFTDL
jgi:GT2 family glycosyltransferase